MPAVSCSAAVVLSAPPAGPMAGEANDIHRAWAARDEHLQRTRVPGEYPERLRSWPPYATVATHGAPPPPRLHTRLGAVSNPVTVNGSKNPSTPSTNASLPPSPTWINSVLATWLVQLYAAVEAPLEPFFAVIRHILHEDGLGDASFESSLRLPALQEKIHARIAADAALAPDLTDRYKSLTRMFSEYYKPLNPMRRFLCDSWVWSWGGPPECVLPLAFECFVEQPSPCCAAATAAGMINMLLQRPRQAYASCSVEDYGESALYRHRQGAGFRACDAIAVMDRDLLDMVAKSCHTSKGSIQPHIAAAVADGIAARMAPGGDLFFPPPTTKVQQRQCLEAVARELGAAHSHHAEASAQLRNLRWKEDGSRACNKPSLRPLYLLVSNVWGLAKLRCPSPSTARFGSWGVVNAVDRLSHQHNLNITGSTHLATSFSFSGFKSLCSTPGIAVSLHLPNHYAVVFGFRKDRIVTARKGQPPTDLVSWAEVQGAQKKSAEGCVIVASVARSAGKAHIPLAVRRSKSTPAPVSLGSEGFQGAAKSGVSSPNRPGWSKAGHHARSVKPRFSARSKNHPPGRTPESTVAC
eukprot:gene6964-10718_t